MQGHLRVALFASCAPKKTGLFACEPFVRCMWSGPSGLDGAAQLYAAEA